jgi:hypothetical protein
MLKTALKMNFVADMGEMSPPPSPMRREEVSIPTTA